MIQQQQLGLGIDPRSLRRSGQPGKADLDGAKIFPAGPASRIPVRRAPYGTAVCPPDLRERDEPLRGPRELGVQVTADLAAARHQGEVVTAAVLLGGRGQVTCVADGQRLQPDQGAFKHGYVDLRLHELPLIAPGVGTLPWQVAGPSWGQDPRILWMNDADHDGPDLGRQGYSGSGIP